MSIATAWKREVRVALSRKAQPAWFRVVKWTVLIGAIALLWGTPHLWLWILGAMALGVGVHLLWRWKTHGWTRPWGGWNDVETANGDRELP